MFNEDLRKPILTPKEKSERTKRVLLPKEIKSKKCEYIDEKGKRCKASANAMIHKKNKVKFVCTRHFNKIKKENNQ